MYVGLKQPRGDGERSWLRPERLRRRLRARWLFYHFISNAGSGNNCYISTKFQNCARCEKDLKDDKDNSLHLRRKYVRIFVLGHYLFLVAHSFPRASLLENCSLLGTMSADKYPSIFSRQIAGIVYIFSRQMDTIVYILGGMLTPKHKLTRCSIF